MRTLDQYIRELLFSHNCVIIPGFGGFVSDYNPSSVHPVQHTFTPPSKKIAFNRKLQNDDGLLANYISEKENITFENARRAIEEQVYQLYLILNEKNTLFLPSIGEFFFDVEKNLQFRENKKINFLLDSFGLDSVQSPAIKREGFSQTLNRQLSERQVGKSGIGKLSKRKKVFLKVSLIAVPLIVIMVWISLFTGVINKVGQFNYSSLIPFSCKKTTEKSVSIYKKPVSVSMSISSKQVTVHPNDEKVKAEVILPEAPMVEEVVETKPIEKTKVETITSSTRNFYIVGGAFGILANAESFVNKLKADGFKPEIIGKNEKGLYLVSYQGFESKKSASIQLKEIKSGYDSSAWIYSLAN